MARPLLSDVACLQCKAPLHGVGPTCPACGKIQELPRNASAFEILGIEESLALSTETLRERFYTLSRQVHPDRHGLSDPREALLANRWSIAVNRAYQILRNPYQRAQYLLERNGFLKETNRKQVPLELAETYFELQDALGEPGGKSRLADFQAQIQSRLDALQEEWIVLETAWVTAQEKKPLFEKLEKHVTVRRFLQSMMADLTKELV